MKTIFRTLACVAALSFFVACGPSVSGDPKEDAKTYIELAKAGKAEAAAEYVKAVVAEYGATSEKYMDFCKEAGVNASNHVQSLMGDFDFE